jgi:glucose 1-dehydrogenase
MTHRGLRETIRQFLSGIYLEIDRLRRKAMSGVDLKGKTAIVTGASLGIGRATAISLGRAGANVVVNYRSNADKAEEVVGLIQESGSKAVAAQGDVADLDSVEKMVALAVQEFGGLDIAVSNAAYSDRDVFYEADMAGFRRTVDVTMWGAFHLMRAATQQMIRQGNGGAIVLVSSPHAFIPAPRAMAYNMSKAAIEHAARTAAIEVAQFKIRINIVQPGWTDTPGELKFASRETLDTAGAKIPLGRLGTAEEMADGILFLCDPRHSYMTGAALLIDGGISLPWWANRGSAAPG